MLTITNQSILSHEESRVNHLLDESNFVTVEEWHDEINEWINDYESGVFDDLKIDLNDANYDSRLKEFYNVLNDKLSEVADRLYDSWVETYSQWLRVSK